MIVLSSEQTLIDSARTHAVKLSSEIAERVVIYTGLARGVLHAWVLPESKGAPKNAENPRPHSIFQGGVAVGGWVR